MIIVRSLTDLGHHCAHFERSLRDLAIFFIAQRSLNDRHPCVKVFLNPSCEKRSFNSFIALLLVVKLTLLLLLYLDSIG